MTDMFTKEKRRQIMSSIGSKDTKPEVAVRRLLHGVGYRFRTHEKSLPGKLDLYFSKNELRYSSTDVFGTAIMNAGEFSTAALYAVALIRRIS